MTTSTDIRVIKADDDDFGTELPAGDYWVGDPCYLFEDHRLWLAWLSTESTSGEDRFRGTLDGHLGEMVGTAHGDGVFYDQHGRAYGVDAGLLGAIPVAAVPDAHQAAPGGGGPNRVVTFTEPFTISGPDPITEAIRIGDLVLSDHVEDEDDEEEYCTQCGSPVGLRPVDEGPDVFCDYECRDEYLEETEDED